MLNARGNTKRSYVEEQAKPYREVVSKMLGRPRKVQNYWTKKKKEKEEKKKMRKSGKPRY